MTHVLLFFAELSKGEGLGFASPLKNWDFLSSIFLTWGSLLLLYSRAAMLLVVPNILSFTSTLSFFNVLFLIHCGLGIQVTQLVRIDPNLRVNAPKQASVPPSEFLWESILQVRCNQF